jgi:hypothetical protein
MYVSEEHDSLNLQGTKVRQVKHDNHVTCQLFIYVQILHISLFSQHVSAAMRHHQVKPNTIHQIISRY